MNNIGTDAMLYLLHWIEQLEGVQDIVPYKTVETDGKFRVLVNKQEFRRTRSILQSELPTWYENHVSPDAQPQTGQFPGAPAVATINSNDYSSGDDSYMTKSVTTFLSFEENMYEDFHHNTPRNLSDSPAKTSGLHVSSLSWANRKELTSINVLPLHSRCKAHQTETSTNSQRFRKHRKYVERIGNE